MAEMLNQRRNMEIYVRLAYPDQCQECGRSPGLLAVLDASLGYGPPFVADFSKVCVDCYMTLQGEISLGIGVTRQRDKIVDEGYDWLHDYGQLGLDVYTEAVELSS